MRIAHYIPAYPGRVDHMLLHQICVEARTLPSEWEYVVTTDSVNGIDVARNRVLHEAMRYEFDYLVMQDADNWTDVPVVERLIGHLREHKDAVISVAPVCLRKPERPLNVYPVRAGVYKAELCGSGLIAIDLGRFKKLCDREPVRFVRSYSPNGVLLEEGGDVAFSRQVREAGGEIIVDATIATRHRVSSVLPYEPTAGVTREAKADHRPEPDGQEES